MSTEATEARGIRLPAAVWKAVESQAKVLKMSSNQFVRCHIEAIVCPAPDVQKSHSGVQPESTEGIFDA